MIFFFSITIFFENHKETNFMLKNFRNLNYHHLKNRMFYFTTSVKQSIKPFLCDMKKK